MSKNKIITTLIACAVLASVLASILIYRYMSPSRGTIFVFNDSYAAGEQVTSDMLTPLQVDANIIVAGRKADVGSQFVTPTEYTEIVKSGESLRMDVGQGMPLTSSMLSVSGGSSVEMNMASGSVAVTVPVNQFTGITNDLKEGSRVNIYANLNGRTYLIQQNKRVLEAYKNGGSLIGASIEESISESMELIYAVTNGEIYLGLVDATGYQATEGADPSYSPYEETAGSTDIWADDEASGYPGSLDGAGSLDSMDVDEGLEEDGENLDDAGTGDEEETQEGQGDTVFTP